VPWRVYRPGIVVGDSRTGVIDEVDGPYRLFKPLQRLRRMFPAWFPLVGPEGRRINLVPVDFVPDAMDHIAHLDDGRWDRQVFHLVDDEPYRGSRSRPRPRAGTTPRPSRPPARAWPSRTC
jgi:thioester reductase-like protein